MATRIFIGNVRDRLAELPDESVQCVVTSPPYFGLRDYGTAAWAGGDPACDHMTIATGATNNKSNNGEAGTPFREQCGKCGATRVDRQIGLEPTLAAYIASLADVFRDVRRVLRSDGTCWLNIGDSYFGTGKGPTPPTGFHKANGDTFYPKKGIYTHDTLKGKDLMMVPASVAIALQDDGWYVRSDVIWHKRAPMPESVTDRPTSAHEHIFLLTKSAKYFYDADAVSEVAADSSQDRAYLGKRPISDRQESMQTNGMHGKSDSLRVYDRSTRNLRNVWTLSPEPYPDAHFATFPTEIPRRCIKAGACAACGSPWIRQTAKSTTFESGSGKAGNMTNGKHGDSVNGGNINLRMGPTIATDTVGWAASCDCDAGTVPCVVLDPFGGSGTTGLVADQLERECILIELNPVYAELARKRIHGASPMFAAVSVL